MRAEAGRDLGGVGADDAAAEDDDVAGLDAGDAAEQDAAAAVELLEVRGALLHRHAARDLAHRREQRQLAASSSSVS